MRTKLTDDCCLRSGGREASARRDLSDGGHWAVFGRAAGGNEETVGGQWSAGMLQSVERVSAERLRQVVSVSFAIDRLLHVLLYAVC